MTRLARRLALLVSIVAACALAGPAVADNFETGFDVGPEQTDPNTPFLAQDGNLLAEFRGGTVTTVGIDRLYRSGTRSWMPAAGDVALITFAPRATAVTLWAINELAGNVATVQFLDDGNTVLAEQTVDSDAQFVEITLLTNTGDPNVAQVRIENSGPGSVAIDDVSFSTDPPGGLTTGDDSDGSALSALALPVLISLAWRRRRFLRASVKG